VKDAGGPGAAIFDMDSVLVDSEPYHRAAWHRLCREEGVMLTLAQVAERTLGRPVRESLPTLLGRPVDTDETERLIRRKATLGWLHRRRPEPPGPWCGWHWGWHDAAAGREPIAQ
jgi:beta-phosphoglucomutase-like phosphatase (HAD superfamily)